MEPFGIVLNGSYDNPIDENYDHGELIETFRLMYKTQREVEDLHFDMNKNKNWFPHLSLEKIKKVQKDFKTLFKILFRVPDNGR